MHQEILRVDGLGQNFEFVALRPRFLQQVGRSRLAGKQENLAGWQQAADLNRSIDAVHVVHDHIADDHLRLDGLGHLDSRFATVCSHRVKTVSVQNNDQRVGDHALVIDHQYLWFHKSSLLHLKTSWNFLWSSLPVGIKESVPHLESTSSAPLL
jgi:hypothetical protein